VQDLEYENTQIIARDNFKGDKGIYKTCHYKRHVYVNSFRLLVVDETRGMWVVERNVEAEEMVIKENL